MGTYKYGRNACFTRSYNKHGSSITVIGTLKTGHKTYVYQKKTEIEIEIEIVFSTYIGIVLPFSPIWKVWLNPDP